MKSTNLVNIISYIQDATLAFLANCKAKKICLLLLDLLHNSKREREREREREIQREMLLRRVRPKNQVKHDFGTIVDPKLPSSCRVFLVVFSRHITFNFSCTIKR